MPVSPMHWEANWAAVPVKYLKMGVRWTPIYDLGVAYENMDFAQQIVEKFNCDVWLDTENEAISLPHKEYFEGEREDIAEHSNRELYEKMWLNG